MIIPIFMLAIARHPEKVRAHDHLIVKADDVYDTEALAGLIRGSDAVISAFNPGWKNRGLPSSLTGGFLFV
jgi:putative NADH-flavin reductase